MATLCIAIGNPLRGDDGAAHRVLELLGPGHGVTARSVVQLAPELAAEIAGFDTVLFIDADVACRKPEIEAVACIPTRATPITHTFAPSEVVSLAERLYGFRGSAMICRLPAHVFDSAEALSPVAEASARSAADLIRKHLLPH